MNLTEHWSRRKQDPESLSESDEWSTPEWLFNWASKRYGPFLGDAASSEHNHKCSKYFVEADNALRRRWWKRTWNNPPYSRGNKEKFTEWGREQVLRGWIDLVCNLIPHDSADGYWKGVVEAPAGRLIHVSREFNQVGNVTQTQWQGLTMEKVELHGRIRYQHNDGSRSSRPGTARHSSALVTLAAPGILRPLRNNVDTSAAPRRTL